MYRIKAIIHELIFSMIYWIFLARKLKLLKRDSELAIQYAASKLIADWDHERDGLVDWNNVWVKNVGFALPDMTDYPHYYVSVQNASPAAQKFYSRIQEYLWRKCDTDWSGVWIVLDPDVDP